jgi:O-methyltransferase involved in polyketide biosynthesis
MRWKGIVADVTDESLVTKLEADGFDPGQPTVWVLEGLLMFLEPESASRLLRLTASASAPGSTLIAHNITNEFLERLRIPGQSVPEGTFFPPALARTWKSGMDADPSDALTAAQWTQQSACSRAQIAMQITGGDPVGKCAFETTQGFGADRHVVFLVAKKPQ